MKTRTSEIYAGAILIASGDFENKPAKPSILIEKKKYTFFRIRCIVNLAKSAGRTSIFLFSDKKKRSFSVKTLERKNVLTPITYKFSTSRV